MGHLIYKWPAEVDRACSHILEPIYSYMHRIIGRFLNLTDHAVAEDMEGKVLIEELWALGYIK